MKDHLFCNSNCKILQLKQTILTIQSIVAAFQCKLHTRQVLQALNNFTSASLHRNSILGHHQREHDQRDELTRVRLYIQQPITVHNRNKPVLTNVNQYPPEKISLFNNTLVLATPISGPALIWMPQAVSRHIVLPTVFVIPTDNAPRFLQ